MKKQFEAVPFVNGLAEPGAVFEGTYLATKTIPTKFGDRPLYEFTLINTNCSTSLKGAEVDVVAGDKVALFGSKTINEGLFNAKPGELVKILYVRTDRTSKGGKKHIFAVSINGVEA